MGRAMKIKTFKFFLIITSCFFFSCSQIKKINAVTTQIKRNFSDASIKSNLYENKRTWRNLSLSVRKIRHFKDRNNNELVFKITPSAHYDRIIFQSGGTRLDGQGEEVPLEDISYRRLAILANFKIIKGTSFGDFSYTLGVGPGVYHIENDQNLNEVSVRSVIKLDLSYTFFITENIFALIGPRVYLEENISVFQQNFRVGYSWF